MLPEYMTTAIRTAEDGDKFVRALVAAGKDWHFDDDPHEVEAFTPAEADALELRSMELRSIPDYDAFGLLVFLTNSPDAFVALDTESMRIYHEGLSAEQRDLLERCKDNPTDEEKEEAKFMIADDMGDRMGFDPAVIDAALQELER